MPAAAPTPDPDPILTRLVARIVDVFEPEAVWLFGSRARGDAGPDSDYDFLVVVPDDRDIQRAWRDTGRIRREPGIGADIVPCRKTVHERRTREVGTLNHAVAQGGRRVYGR